MAPCWERAQQNGTDSGSYLKHGTRKASFEEKTSLDDILHQKMEEGWIVTANFITAFQIESK